MLCEAWEVEQFAPHDMIGKKPSFSYVPVQKLKNQRVVRQFRNSNRELMLWICMAPHNQFKALVLSRRQN